MTRRKSYIAGALCAIILALIFAVISFSRSPVTPNTIKGVWQRLRLTDETAIQLHTVEADPHKLSKFIVFGSNGAFETNAGGDVVARGTYMLLDNGRIKLTIGTLDAIYTIRINGDRLSLASDLMSYEYYRSELPPPL